MLSYHKNNKDVVSEIYQILQDEHLPVCFDENRDANSLCDRYEIEVIFFFRVCNCISFFVKFG
jgi:hypothetical protein